MSEQKAVYEPMKPETRETIRDLQEQTTKEQIRIQTQITEAVQRDDKRQQQKMEKEIEREAAEAAQAAADAVRARYREKNPQIWNDGKSEKAMRGLLAGLRG